MPNPPDWSLYKIPFRLSESGVVLSRPTVSGSYLIEGVGEAQPLDLRNEADARGELFRLRRRPHEDDYSYLGRLQRLCITARLGFSSGSEGRITRTVASYLGRVTITPPWDGRTPVSLPSDVSFLDPLSVLPQSETYRLSQGTLIPLPNDGSGNPLLTYAPGGSPAAFRCPRDLNACRHRLSIEGQTLLRGRDYLLDADPTVFLLRQPLLGQDLSLSVSTPDPVRISLTGDALPGPNARSSRALGSESLPSVYGGFQGGQGLWLGTKLGGFTPHALAGTPGLTASSLDTTPTPLFLGRGVGALGLPRMEMTSLRLPGGMPSLTGVRLLPVLHTAPAWGSRGSPATPFGIPLDL